MLIVCMRTYNKFFNKEDFTYYETFYSNSPLFLCFKFDSNKNEHFKLKLCIGKCIL